MSGHYCSPLSPGTPVSYNIDRHNIVESGVAHHNPNSHGTLKKMTSSGIRTHNFRGDKR
jgi:hypothetical protein